jgi:hypothetical protein
MAGALRGWRCQRKPPDGESAGSRGEGGFGPWPAGNLSRAFRLKSVGPAIPDRAAKVATALACSFQLSVTSGRPGRLRACRRELPAAGIRARMPVATVADGGADYRGRSYEPFNEEHG